MDFFASLAIAFIMFSPFLVAGFLVFVCLAFITFLLAQVSPANSRARRNITHIGLGLSFFAAVILSVPVAVLFVYSKIEDKGKPKNDAFAQLKYEMRRDAREYAWPPGTVTALERWVDLEGGQYRDELRLEFANNIALKIDTNKLETNATDFAIIEKLAQRPYALDSYSDYLIASAIAYVHLHDIGFNDVGHPERFRRSPGHNASANGTDYTTYLKVAIVRCTQDPELAGCHETFTEAEISRFETQPDHANSFNWLERKELLPPLRAALGYPVPSP